MQDWDDVRVLLAVLRHGGFTPAAHALGVNQSTVSRRIGELEARLGQALFHRSARAFGPTELAERLRPGAEAAEAAMVALSRAVADPARVAGVVRVATAEELATALLVPAFRALRRAHPDLHLELVGAGQVADLEQGEADVALRVIPPEQGDLLRRAVATVRYAPYASRGYLRGRSDAPLSSLDWLSLFDPRGILPEAEWVRRRLGARAPVLATNNTLDLAAAAAAGTGAALLPDRVAARYDNLIRLEDGAAIERKLWLVVPRALAEVARVRAVMDWIVEACRFEATPA